VLADGISSSNVSHIASESAVKSFLTDYYCTLGILVGKDIGAAVLAATNSWLHAQTRRSQYAYDNDKGYVCTLSAMVLKSTTAHIFHIGDSRIYRVAGNTLEQLTIGPSGRGLIRAELFEPRAGHQSPDRDRLPGAPNRERRRLGAGDRRRLRACRNALRRQGDCRHHARSGQAPRRIIVEEAYAQGSPDNLTVQIVRIEELPDGEASEVFGHRPTAAAAAARAADASSTATGSSGNCTAAAAATSTSRRYRNRQLVALKIPSIDLRDDPAYLKRFMMEEWVARRLDSAACAEAVDAFAASATSSMS
jgi:hypothetical protein